MRSSASKRSCSIAGDVERLHRVADQRELRHQLLRRRRPLRLVLRVDLVAERLRAGIEDDGEVGRLVAVLGLPQQLPQHLAEAVHRADRQPVGRPRQRRQRMEGAENVAGAVDQIDPVAFADMVAGGRTVVADLAAAQRDTAWR